MAYTNNDGADPTKPDGAVTAANTIDTEIQKVKLAYNERLAYAFGGDWSTATEAVIDKLRGVVNFNGTGKQANQPFTDLGNIFGTVNLDFDVRGNYITFTATADVTFTFSNVRVGTTYVLLGKQDGVGNNDIFFPSSVRWPGGSTPTFNYTANTVNMYTLTPYSSSIILGSLSGTGYNVS